MRSLSHRAHADTMQYTEPALSPVSQFLNKIIIDDVSPEYLAKIIDADIITVEELCDYMAFISQSRLNDSGLESLVKIITDRRPDLFNADLGNTFVRFAVWISNSSDVIRGIIKHSGYVPDTKSVLTFHSDLFTEFFDESSDLISLIIKRTVINPDNYEVIVQKVIRDIAPDTLSVEDINTILIELTYSGNRKVELFWDLFDTIIGQRADRDSLLKLYIRELVDRSFSPKFINISFTYMKSRDIRFDCEYIDYIKHLSAENICNDWNKMTYTKLSTEMKLFDFNAMGTSERMETYGLIVGSCIPKSIKNKYRIISKMHLTRRFCDVPTIPEDKLDALLDSISAKSLDFDERAELFQKILELAEADPNINEYIQNRGDSD